MQHFLGLMSGTSLDGCDVAELGIEVDPVHVQGSRLSFLGGATYPFPHALRAKVLRLAEGGAASPAEICEIEQQLGSFFADSCLQYLSERNSRDAICGIGLHGQTVWHEPPRTWQMGDANIIATRTGAPVVADFRRMDLAHGGQGAPLIPFFHDKLFRSNQETRVVLNIGGISNITILRPGQNCFGYDTGPGNTLLDAYCRKHFNCEYDKNASLAMQGPHLQ